MSEDRKTDDARKTTWQKIRRFFAWMLFLVLLLSGALSALLFIYEDEVKAAIISELNKHLKSEVKIDPGNIDLTIIKTFPDCSIQFKNVLILEALQVKNRDTLIFAGQLNLHFNIKDLWNKKYAIEKIKIKNGVIKPQILKNGKNNFTIWEAQNTDQQHTNELNFVLELVAIENCRLQYKDKQIPFESKIMIKALSFKGNFSASQYQLSSEGKLFINKVVHEKKSLLENKACKFVVDMNVANNRYTVNKANFHLNQLHIDLNGGFNYKDSLTNADLTFHAPELDIASLLSLLPVKYAHKINDYKSNGSFYADGKLHYRSQQDFILESDFGIKKGSITYQPQATTVNQVALEGHLKFGPSLSLLEIKNIFLRLNNDELKGNGFISNFSDPYIKFSVGADFNLANLQAFWPIDTLTRLEGGIKINADLEGLLKNFKEQTFSPKVKLDLNASVSNLVAQFKNDEQLFSAESGSVIIVNREMEVQNLKLKRGSSDLLLSGKLQGFFNYLSEPNTPLTITGNLLSNYLKMEDFMMKNQASGGESDLIPSQVSFKLNATIQKFTYSKFLATAITGEIDVANQKAIVTDMTLKTMGGTATIDAFADNARHKLAVVFQSKLKHINIQELFSEFNNFGQSTLQDKNIKGFVSAEVDFSASWNNRLDVDLGSIRSNCNLLVEGGELIDFKPLVSLSKFVDLEDLQHIRFSTLQSEVLIKNKLITLPKTLLKNSALNIIFSGTHSFDNAIDYHIRLVISELLAKKRKADDEFGPVEEDKEKMRSAYILMTGTIDNPERKFDRKGQKEKIREDIKQEKQNIKKVLREELGLFKKQELPQKEKKTEQKFELEKPNNNSTKKTLEPKKKPVEEDF